MEPRPGIFEAFNTDAWFLSGLAQVDHFSSFFRLSSAFFEVHDPQSWVEKVGYLPFLHRPDLGKTTSQLTEIPI